MTTKKQPNAKTIRSFKFDKSDFVKKDMSAANCSAFEDLLHLLDVPIKEWKDIYSIAITIKDFRLHKTFKT